MAEPELSNSPTAGTPTPEPREKTIACDACDSTLYRDGSVKKLSDRMKRAMESSDKLSELRSENESLRNKVAELEVKLANVTPGASAPQGSSGPKRSGFALNF